MSFLLSTLLGLSTVCSGRGSDMNWLCDFDQVSSGLGVSVFLFTRRQISASWSLKTPLIGRKLVESNER